MALVNKSPEQVFTEIFSANKWGDAHSVSGPGSRLDRTESIRRELPSLLAKIECQSILDIPCGDFHWMKEVDLGNIQYIGADIVADLVMKNNDRYAGKNVEFKHLDLIHDPLPYADLVMCRDCLIHLSFSDIFLALRNIRNSGSKYLLTTTYTKRLSNENILTGEFRAINLQLPPFNFPAPLELVDETIPLPDYIDKNMGLWKIEDVPVS